MSVSAGIRGGVCVSVAAPLGSLNVGACERGKTGEEVIDVCGLSVELLEGMDGLEGSEGFDVDVVVVSVVLVEIREIWPGLDEGIFGKVLK